MSKQEISKKKADYSEININDTYYTTLLTKKYNKRKPYTPKNPRHIASFMPGTIQKVFTEKGAVVKEGDKLLILEAMKMKNIIIAPFDGIIKSINVKEGQMVPKDHLLIEMK